MDMIVSQWVQLFKMGRPDAYAVRAGLQVQVWARREAAAHALIATLRAQGMQPSPSSVSGWPSHLE